jgi:hypothetical protein
MKNWIQIILAVMLCVIAVGGIAVLLKNVEPKQEDSSSTESTSCGFSVEIELNEESLIF